MKSTRFLLGSAALALAMPASADTLREALVKAYATNPTLTGARASLRAQDETVPIARSEALPSLAASGDYTENLYTLNGNSLTSPQRSGTTGLNASLPVYNGGRIRAGVRAAETRVEAARAGLRGTEAGLFTQVVGAYMDVIRDESIVRLNQANVHVLEVNLQATRDRFEVGDLTRTDVAQSEARLALAQGQLRGAEATLIGSRENYVRLVGSPPVQLETPQPLPNLPDTPEAAVSTAIANNPDLQSAKQSLDATQFDIDAARASRSPQVAVVAGGNYQNYFGSLGAGRAVTTRQSSLGGSAGLALSLPLFQGGRPAAQVRRAQALRGQAIEQVTGAERAVISSTRASYANWRSSQQVIQSSEVAVSANRLSLEGVRAENSVGTRTILEILNAEQELLDSQVTLVSARRNAYVAGFALLAAMGQAEARDLGLDGGPLYDPTSNYNRNRNRRSDRSRDPDPQPVATSTATTPAQTPAVSPVEDDPMLAAPVDRDTVPPAGGARTGR